MALPTYSTGTVSVGADGAVTVSSGIWSGSNVVEGDRISVDNGADLLISGVTDAAHGQIVGWSGGSVSDKAYVVYKTSSRRFDDVQIADDLKEQVQALNTEGYFVFVASDAAAPDPSLGDDGMYALQPSTGKLWYKEGGAWNVSSNFRGIKPDYTVNEITSTASPAEDDRDAHDADPENTIVLVASEGKIYVKLSATSGDWSDGVAVKGDQGEQGEQGPAGNDGADGADGAAATITVGTVSTVAYGEPATVTNSGTSGAAVFDFEIPAGQDGTGTGDMQAANNLSELTDPDTAVDNLGGTTTGKALFTATNAADALDTLGATTVGVDVLTAVDAAAARTALEISPGMSNSERQNFLLTTAYQSKSFAEFRRLVGLFATGFKGANDTANGIATASSSNYSVDSSGGKVSPTLSSAGTSYSNAGGSGNRSGVVAVTSTFSAGASSASALVDGAYAAPGYYASPGQTTGVWTFDFGAGAAKYIDEIKWYQDVAANNGTFIFEASNDGLAWVAIATNLVLGVNVTTTLPFVPATKELFRYFRLRMTSGSTSAAAYLKEIEFKISNTAPSVDNMTLVTAAQTADASVSNARVLLEYDDTATPAINTDLTVEVTCDGGSNWATATLSSVTAYSQGGRKVVETVDTACASGTSFAARIKTLNNKSVPIYALALQVH